MGCRLSVEKTADGITVTGNTCPSGKAYAIDELTAPKRMVTSSVPVAGGNYHTVSVKTSASIPKQDIFNALAELKGVSLVAPVSEGQIVVRNVAGTGADFIATRVVAKK